MEFTHYRERRDKLLSLLPDRGMAIIPSAVMKTRSHDTEFPFRQDSNFKYLSGFNEPCSVLVLLKENNDFSQVIFVQDKDPAMEQWTGIRLGVLKAKEYLEMDAAFSINEFDEKLVDLMEGHEHVYVDVYNQAVLQRTLQASRNLANKRKREVHKPTSFTDITPIIGRMRLIKDQNELLFMSAAQAITAKAHRAAMAFMAPGKNESEVHALMEYIFKKEGASGNAYDSIVAGGQNANILHYIQNDQHLTDGDLLLIDAGSEVNHYASDVTRTTPINGKYTGAQKELYELVLASMKHAFASTRPGSVLKAIHEDTCLFLTKGMVDLGILQGDAQALYEEGAYKKYYPHGTGHWLGLDVHDNCPYLTHENKAIPLMPGMVFTIEPGLYLPEDDSDIPEKFRGIGIRIEDDILITEKGHENLSASIPKEIKEVEEACTHDYRDFLL